MGAVVVVWLRQRKNWTRTGLEGCPGVAEGRPWGALKRRAGRRGGRRSTDSRRWWSQAVQPTACATVWEEEGQHKKEESQAPADLHRMVENGRRTQIQKPGDLRLAMLNFIRTIQNWSNKSKLDKKQCKILPPFLYVRCIIFDTVIKARNYRHVRTKLPSPNLFVSGK